MNKYLALQKDVFDISKVTVVGSPTITSDGVASGFNGTSDCVYSEVDASILDGTKDILVEGEFTTSDALGGLQGIFYLGSLSNTAGVYFRVNNAKFDLIVFTAAEVYSSVLSTSYMVANTTYYYKIYFDKNTKRFTLKISLDGKNYNDECSLIVNQIYLPNNAIILWGCRHLTNFAQQFKGSINLPATKVYSNNQLIYSPTKPTYLLERRKEGYDPSKFTIVGSPTITEYGVASGFSGSDYLTIPTIDLSQTDSFELILPYITPSELSGGQKYIYVGDTFNMSVNPTAYLYYFNLTFEDDTKAVFYDHTSISKEPNSLYLIKLTFNINEGYKAYYKLPNSNEWVLHKTNTTTKRLKASTFINKIGQIYSTGAYGWDGAVPLSSISITVDGKEVFTGAKENYYMLNGI